MAYDKNKIYEQAKDLIEKKKLFFIEDVVTLLPISKTTFYEYFAIESNELDTIKELLDKNKIREERGQWQVINLVLPAVVIVLLGLILNWNRKRKFANH